MSVPKIVGEIESGEKVLSTTNLILCFFAIAAKPRKSATSSNGLLTVSQKIILDKQIFDFQNEQKEKTSKIEKKEVEVAP